MNNNPIGVFDSGIGGLSVLKQFVRFLPFESYIYLGDTARVPYGNRSPEIVKLYARQSTEFLLEKNVKLIVTACNTVSAVALEEVRKTAGDVPVIDMISPAASAALRATVNKRIGVIGTRATVASGAYEKQILEFSSIDNSPEVFTKACPLLVPFVEEGMATHPAVKLVAEEYLQELIEKNVDTLVMGCTHYPLLVPMIREIMPNISLIDTGEHASVTALRLLAERGDLVDERNSYMEKPKVEFYITDLPALFYENAAAFLGFEIDKPNIIQLDKKR
jgi:glutamate racemase